MALSVHRPVGGGAPCFPFSVNAPHLAVQAIRAGGDNLVAEGEDGNPVYLGVFMISGTAGADGTQPTLADHPILSTKFILDSGASTHATGDESLFPWVFRVQEGVELSVANGHKLAVHGFGPVITEKFRVDNVAYVPGLTSNVISVSALSDLDYSVVFARGGVCEIKDLRTGEQVGSASLVGGLYVLDRLEIPLGRAP